VSKPPTVPRPSGGAPSYGCAVASGPPITSRRFAAPARWLALLTVGFALNVGWELAQAPLYGGRPPTAIYVGAAINDALLIAVAVAAGMLASRRWTPAFWPVLVIGLGATALFIEARALASDRWSYAEAMPTVGAIGLSPLVQLPLLGALAVLAVWRGRAA